MVLPQTPVRAGTHSNEEGGQWSQALQENFLDSNGHVTEETFPLTETYLKTDELIPYMQIKFI